MYIEFQNKNAHLSIKAHSEHGPISFVISFFESNRTVSFVFSRFESNKMVMDSVTVVQCIG